MKILFRACDDVYAINGAKRPYNLTKDQLSTLCFLSLIQNGYSKEDIIVFGDRLSDAKVKFYQQHAGIVFNKNMGISGSLIACHEFAVNHFTENEWVYFCEDDYLHIPRFKITLDDFTKNFKRDFYCIHTCDDPLRYVENKPHEIYISNFSHWKNIVNTTFSYIIQVKLLIKFFDIYIKACQRNDDGLICKKIYQENQILCVSPMPALTSHMHEIVMSPVVDWLQILNQFF